MRRNPRRDRSDPRAAPAPGAQALTAADRDQSLDVFRGVTVAAMILVNNPGDWTAVFPPLLHQYFFGWTFADLVFPWFVFIMGVTLPLAFARRLARGDDAAMLHRRIVRRVVLLIALGLFLNAVAAWPQLAPLRIPGVLQRIGLAYLIASVVVLHSGVAAWAAAAVVLMLGHWILLALVPFGGHPAGTITPEQNLAGYVDAAVFGRHLLRMPIDPEGLLGTITAAATALVGALVGEVVRRAPAVRLRVMLVIGTASLLAGVAWSVVLPISKPLWTGSYVLLACGLGTLTLAFISLILDVVEIRSWAQPFRWLGVNPLAIYFLSEFVGHVLDHIGAKSALFWNVLEPTLRWPTEWISLLFGVCYVACWMGVAGLFERYRLRITV